MHQRPLTPLQEQKDRLRAERRGMRRAHREGNVLCAEKLVDVFLQHVALEKSAVVASYCPIHDEIDPEALNDALRARGHKIALPIVTGKHAPLIFRLYEKGDRLLGNPMGIFEPTSAAEGVEPNVLLIPLLAFDRLRNRLGYGGGYYDRTIKKLRAKKSVLTIGVAYSYQEVDAVPTGSNDVLLDRIVTELNVF